MIVENELELRGASRCDAAGNDVGRFTVPSESRFIVQVWLWMKEKSNYRITALMDVSTTSLYSSLQENKVWRGRAGGKDL